MDATPYLERVREDEGLTSDLDEQEATQLLAWLTGQVERIAATEKTEAGAWDQVDQLCRRARATAKVVALLRDEGMEAARDRAQRAGLSWPANAGTITQEALLRQLLDGGNS